MVIDLRSGGPFQNAWKRFLNYEATDRDAIKLNLIYVDIAGKDLIAGLLLSRIIYWHMPSNKDQKTRLRVKQGGYLWLAKNRDQWWDECRITPKQYDRAIEILTSLKIVTVENHMFDGKRTPFIRVNPVSFIELLEDYLSQVEDNSEVLEENAETSLLPEGIQRCYRKVNTAIDQTARPLTGVTSLGTSLGTVVKVSDETFTTHGVESPTRVPQPPPPIGSTTSGFPLPVYPTAKEVKAAQAKEKRIAEKTASARVMAWGDDTLLKVRDFVHAYNRGIAEDGRVVPEPDAAAMERNMSLVIDIDSTRYTPEDFEEAARYYYRTWNGKVSIKSLVGLLSEWDAKGRPKIKRIESVLPSGKRVETYGEMKMREYEEALMEEAQIASMAVH
jgi:hypothetical protein